MTDTQTEQNELAAIDATGASAEQIAAELQAARDAIADRLAALHAEDDPDRRLAIAENTQEWCNYLTALTENAAALTGTAVVVAREAVQQRDAALDELARLVEDVRFVNTDNELVQALVSEVEEMAYESFHEDGFHSSCPGCDVGNRGMPIDHDEMNQFLYYVFHYDGDNWTGDCGLSERLQRRLATLIHLFVRAADRETGNGDAAPVFADAPEAFSTDEYADYEEVDE